MLAQNVYTRLFITALFITATFKKMSLNEGVAIDIMVLTYNGEFGSF